MFYQIDSTNKIVSINTSKETLGNIPDGYSLLESSMIFDVGDTFDESNYTKHSIKVLAQIAELDSKRSRAFFEPSEKEVGLTWLEYYNQEITKLRNELI